MDSKILDNLFYKHFLTEGWACLKERELPKKPVLLDNAPSYLRERVLTSDNSHIIAKFLSTSATANTQLTHQEVTVSIK